MRLAAYAEQRVDRGVTLLLPLIYHGIMSGNEHPYRFSLIRTDFQPKQGNVSHMNPR